ncbi:MAG: LptA/OstA family protein [Opitutales bacterium]|nr:LptA/OstA family protein [Opitutales bacterium]
MKTFLSLFAKASPALILLASYGPANLAATEEPEEAEASLTEETTEPTEAASTETSVEPANTVILSDVLEIFTEEDPIRFLFQNNVRVEAEEFTLTCDYLEILREIDEPEDDLSAIRLITARGNLLLTQEDRILTAETGVIDPREETITLVGDPILQDSRGSVRGDRIILYQKDGRARIEGREDLPARVEIPRIEGFRMTEEEEE